MLAHFGFSEQSITHILSESSVTSVANPVVGFSCVADALGPPCLRGELNKPLDSSRTFRYSELTE